MEHIKRVYTSVNHKEPDKVPKGELGVHEGAIRSLLGKDYSGENLFDNTVNVANLLKMDMVTTWVDAYHCVSDNKNEKVFEDGWGRVWIDNGFTTSIVKRPLKNIEDIHKLSVPSLDDCNFSFLKRLREETDLFVVALIGGPFGYGVDFLGFEEFLLSTITHKKEVKYLMNIIAGFYAEVGKRCIEEGAHMIVIGDDVAYNRGTFLSPESLRELVFPFMSKEVREIKKDNEGIPVFLHSDGNLNGVMEDIIESDFDGIHSLQPSSGMDIGEIKKTYGDRLCLWGNIDLDYLLPFGTEKEVKKSVGETIKIAFPGGGYILGTCNVLTENIPKGNIIAMYNAGEESNRRNLEDNE